MAIFRFISFGGVGVGLFSSIREADRVVRETEVTPCDPANFPVYRKNYALFRSCYERLHDLFPQLGR